jgi:hypothetical protein
MEVKMRRILLLMLLLALVASCGVLEKKPKKTGVVTGDTPADSVAADTSGVGL